MMCEECKTAPASVLVVSEINGEKQARRLCPSCAQRYQKALQASFGMNFGMNDLLSGLLETVKQTPTSPVACESCGITYAQFREGGMLGCAQCYNVFRPQLKPLLQRIHGGTTHSGKLPLRSGGQIKRRRELEQLKSELNNAIKAEEYEQAAMLRDEIRTMQAELYGGEQ